MTTISREADVEHRAPAAAAARRVARRRALHERLQPCYGVFSFVTSPSIVVPPICCDGGSRRRGVGVVLGALHAFLEALDGAAQVLRRCCAASWCRRSARRPAARSTSARCSIHPWCSPRSVRMRLPRDHRAERVGPPMTCTWTCMTSCRPMRPVLTIVRKPSRRALLARERARPAPASCRAPRASPASRRASDAMCFFGISMKCTGASGLDVVEREDLVVLVDLAARDLAAHDLAEDAVRVVGHAPIVRFAKRVEPAVQGARTLLGDDRTCLRAARARPARPRAPRPWRASSTRQWNHRSATSATHADFITVLRGHDRLGRLLADLLQDRVVALARTAPRRRTARDRRRCARLDRRGDAREHVVGRRQSSAIDRLRVLRARARPSTPCAVVEPPEEAALAARCGRRCRPPARRRSRIASPSQSRRISRTRCTWPDARPCATACARERDQ